MAKKDKDARLGKGKDERSARRATDNIQSAYEEAVRQGKGDQFLKNHPQFAEKTGQQPKSEDEIQAEKDAAKQEEIKTNVTDIAKTAGDYGKDFANEYLPEGTFGTIDAATTPEMKAYLDRINQFVQTAYDMTGDERKSLDYLESGLGGYTSPEVQAMRESAKREMKREYQTMLEQARVNQIQSGVRGAAAGAQFQDLATSRIQAGKDLEQDLLIKNADAVQQRKQAFADAVRKTEDARFGRKTASEGMYGAALSGEEAARTGREMFNVGQGQNEALARSGLALSGAGLYSGLYGAESGLQAAQEQFRDMLAQQQEWQKFAMEETRRARKTADERYDDQWNWMTSQ